MSSNLQLKVKALQGMSGKIREIVSYLNDVKEGKLPPNNKIMFMLQVKSFQYVGNYQLASQLEL